MVNRLVQARQLSLNPAGSSSSGTGSAVVIGPRNSSSNTSSNITATMALGLGNPLDPSMNYVVKFNQ